MKIRIFKTFATLAIFIAFFFTALDAKAQTVWTPPGSWQQSCSDARSENNGRDLHALCNLPDNFLKGKPLPNPTTLSDYFLCDGDIWNKNGTLMCNKNENSKPMQIAKNLIRDGLVKATGKPPSAQQITNVLYQMLTIGYGQEFFAGLKQSQVDGFLNSKISDPSYAAARAKIIKQAYYDAWGWNSITPQTFAKWDATIKSTYKPGYSQSDLAYETILKGEIAEINKDKITKRLVAMNAYKAAVGRAATQTEMDFWSSKIDTSFRHIVESLRGTMRQSIGAKLLVEMYKNVLECKGIKATDAEIQQLIVKHSADKFVYDDLCK